MKTRIIYHNAYGNYRRAIHPDDAKQHPEQYDKRLLETRVPYFKSGGERIESSGVYLTAKGIKKGPKEIRITDDRLVLEDGMETIKFVYGKAKAHKQEARIITQEDTDALDEIDQQIEHLNQLRNEHLKMSFQRGKTIVRGDAQYWEKPTK